MTRRIGDEQVQARWGAPLLNAFVLGGLPFTDLSGIDEQELTPCARFTQTRELDEERKQ